jgi:hypothetical protein
MTLKARLARLETAHDGAARVIVIGGPKGLNVAEELGTRAITAADRDLVVVIAKPATSLVGATVDGQPVADRIAGTVAST